MAADADIRRDHERRAPDPGVDDLIAQVHRVFVNAGIAASWSKVRRLVRAWPGGQQQSFVDYLAGAVAESDARRQRVTDDLRWLFEYCDPTGEEAVANVLRRQRDRHQ